MKLCCLIILAALCGLNLRAQTNAPAATNLTARAPTRIESKSGEFDMNTHQAIYHGHVRVTSPEMKLTCERLVADLPPTGGRPEHIVCETNVVIDFTDEHGKTNHVTSEKAVYDFHVVSGVTNETVTLTGNPKPRVENEQSITVADVIVWDRANNRFQFTNQKMIFRQNFDVGPAATNSPPKNTKELSAPK
jgi:lipopolysaccharide transport protein LptA